MTLPYPPPGVEMEGPIVLSPTESRAVFRLSARPDADPVSWRLAAEVKSAPPRRDRRAMTIALQNAIDPTAAGGTQGGRRRMPVDAAPQVASKFVPIELSASTISGRFAPSTVEQGKTVVVALELDVVSPFVGSLEARLEGLPPRASSRPIKMVPGMRRLEFPVAVAATTPVGEFGSLLCRISGEINGQVFVYHLGRGGALKVVAAGALTLDADGKPLRPLEALRRKERSLAASKKP